MTESMSGKRKKKKQDNIKKNQKTVAFEKTGSGFLKTAGMWQIQIIILAAAVMAVYGHTFDVPFYLDDFPSIKENTAISDCYDIKSLWRYAPLRIVGYFSFALNYHLHKFSVAGYHVVNLMIHLLAVGAVFMFAKGLTRTSSLKGKINQSAAKWFPFLSAAVFALHPLQTQAVTYIVQRLASMAAMFYIFSLLSYLYARISINNVKRWLWFSSFILFALLALFTKQNTVTLPVAVFMIEWIFFSQNKKQLGLIVFFAIISLGAALAAVRFFFQYDPFSLDALQALTRDTTIITRKEYLNTQFVVLWKYIRLFFWPAGLHLDYDVPVLTDFFDWRVICSMTAHLCALAAAVLMKKRFPVVAFAVLFYYLAHLVESSLIPIRDLLFEHRTYLPNLGLCLGAGWLAAVFLSNRKKTYIAATVVGLLLLSMSAVAWQRNQMWRNPLSFWRDCAERSPQKMRPWNTLGVMLLQAGKDNEAEKAFERALQARQYKTGVQTAAANLIILRRRSGKLKEALQMADFLLKQDITLLNRSKVINSKGNIYFAMKQYIPAEKCYRQAIDIYPKSLFAMNNLAHIFIISKRPGEAKDMFIEILKIDPQHKEAKHNLALLKRLLKKQRLDEKLDD